MTTEGSLMRAATPKNNPETTRSAFRDCWRNLKKKRNETKINATEGTSDMPDWLQYQKSGFTARSDAIKRAHPIEPKILLAMR